MNIFALISGCVVALAIIAWFRKTRLEKKRLPYPLLLATFPIYYLVFAFYAKDYYALVNEAFASIVFILITLFAYAQRNALGLLILASGYTAHAVYDIAHDLLFLNRGTPLWWPEFCAAVDGFLGLYLLILALELYKVKSNV